MELIVGDSLQGFGAGIPAQDVNEAYGIDLGLSEGQVPRARFEPPGIELGHVVQEKAEISMPIHTFSVDIRPCIRLASAGEAR
jgi:hypothetical protein